MIQYANEKDPQSDWASPPPASSSSSSNPRETPAYPPPAMHTPNPYAAPPTHGQTTSGYATPGEYHAPPQGYPPPVGPPPVYTSVQGHPDAQPSYDRKSPYPPEVIAPPPSNNPYGAPGYNPGPSSSSSSSSGQGSSGMSLGSFFGNKGSPPMWQRPPPVQLPYNSFPPMCLISNKNTLGGGFPELPPPCQLNPHPFSTHDITEEDWKRFLADVKSAGSLSAGQQIKSNVLPMVMGAGLLGGFFLANGIQKRMSYKNRNAAGDIVNHWNHYFFGPRRMEVVLCQASERLSGRFGSAPVGDPNQVRMARGLRRGGDDSSSDSSEDERRGHGHGRDNFQQFDQNSGRQARRAARRERREARRARKAERREWKDSGASQEPYQLFVTATN